MTRKFGTFVRKRVSSGAQREPIYHDIVNALGSLRIRYTSLDCGLRIASVLLIKD